MEIILKILSYLSVLGAVVALPVCLIFLIVCLIKKKPIRLPGISLAISALVVIVSFSLLVIIQTIDPSLKETSIGAKQQRSLEETLNSSTQPTTKPMTIASTTATTATKSTTTTTTTATTKASVPSEYKSALAKANSYANSLYMSKANLYEQLTSSYGEAFSEEAAQYAIDNVTTDYKKNALKKAKSYRDTQNMSPARIYEQLTSEYGEGFTPDEAQYAIDNLD